MHPVLIQKMRYLLLLATFSALFRFAVAFRRFESFPTKTMDVLKGGIAFHDADLSKSHPASYKRRYDHDDYVEDDADAEETNEQCIDIFSNYTKLRRVMCACPKGSF